MRLRVAAWPGDVGDEATECATVLFEAFIEPVEQYGGTEATDGDAQEPGSVQSFEEGLQSPAASEILAVGGHEMPRLAAFFRGEARKQLACPRIAVR